ncbi:Ig-like domain-containing protein [Aeromicrobium wangtongii]|uniref:Ig-like domain-containing protein n=1 Tax=Aeromicrobium wangtongii TaxID=2969247 RepID=A0ABY5MAL1_9ACTN|nr:Ig-like domain-containing protein [Aeromicrobium wangtongii]MCD9199801.1 Ig-like domain-containing protein [Aeromicrobium wangtongii]UUP14151.1 Ig-like domain-containing protein [Aeromicrobium wangtongii]
MSSTPRHREKVNPMPRRLSVMIVVLAAVVASISLTGSSSASYVSSTASTGTVSAAADWTPPTIAVTPPAGTVSGTTKITAVATDDVSGVAGVTIQRATAGSSTWTTVCETRTTPYACDWNTTSLADGSYDLRAVALDTAGNTSTSATVRANVSNRLTVSLDRPGDFLRGPVTTAVTLSNVGALQVSSVRVEFAPTGTTNWTTICSSTAKPYTCSVDTKIAPNGSYDLRAIAVVGTTSYTSPVVSKVIVDNAAPTGVKMTDPGTPLNGTKTFEATATDAHSGIAEVVFQASSGTKWTDLCTATGTPSRCSYDTNKLDNDTYTFRAVATDRAGNSTTSAEIRRVVVKNTFVTLTPPSTHLRGNVTLQAQAEASTTIRSVKIQRAGAGSNSWTDICTDTNSPYSCTFATAGVADGTYDLRAVLTENNGTQTISEVVADRIVDNTRATGIDIQTTNGSGINGKVDSGDTVVYTFSEQMDLSSIYSGWSGDATSGTLKVKGGFFVSDSFDISSPSNLRIGSVELNADFALWLVDATANMTVSAQLDDLGRTVVTVKLLSTPSTGQRVTDPATMVWTPSSSMTDLAGNSVSTTDVSETGPSDVDF